MKDGATMVRGDEVERLSEEIETYSRMIVSFPERFWCMIVV